MTPFTPTRTFPRFVSPADLSSRIAFAEPENPPAIILSLGTVRCGSKASLRVFGESGIRSFSQPVKSILRDLLLSRDGPATSWDIPDAGTIYVKETFGPFNFDECCFDPLAVIMDAHRAQLRARGVGRERRSGYTRLLLDRMNVVVMGRDPVAVWLSNVSTYQRVVREVRPADLWYYTVPTDSLFEYTVYAYKNVERVRQTALGLGVRVSHYLDEANRTPETSYARLFHRLGIAASPRVSGWTHRSTLGGDTSNVVLLENHETELGSVLFDEINRTSGVFFRRGQAGVGQEPAAEAMRAAGVFALYEGWREQYAVEMGTPRNLDGGAAWTNREGIPVA